MQRNELQKSLSLFLLLILFSTSINKYPSVDARLQDASKKLLIFLFRPEVKTRTSYSYSDYTLDSSNEYQRNEGSYSGEHLTESSSPKDEEAYFLYHILRTQEDNGNLNSRLSNTIQKTKDLLRPMLRARCQKLDKCKKKCPKKKKKSCPKKCQIKIDTFDVCKPSKQTCKTVKCGRTMPPRWPRVGHEYNDK